MRQCEGGVLFFKLGEDDCQIRLEDINEPCQEEANILFHAAAEVRTTHTHIRRRFEQHTPTYDDQE